MDDAVRYAVTPFPAGRRVVLDVLQAATHRLCVHALVEFDVTEARRRLADAPEHVSPGSASSWPRSARPLPSTRS